MPEPAGLRVNDGSYILLYPLPMKKTKVILDKDGFEKEVQEINLLLRKFFGITVTLSSKSI